MTFNDFRRSQAARDQLRDIGLRPPGRDANPAG
jgi:hypothetical protein